VTRREYVATLTTLAASGIVALIFTGQPWARVTSPGVVGTQTLEASGSDLTGAVRAVGLLSLAGVLVIVATKGWWRRVIGLGIAAAAVLAVLHLMQIGRDLAEIVAAWAEISADGVDEATVESTSAIWVATSVCVAVAIAGVLTAARGHHWSTPLAKYERRRVKPAEDAWDVLDRGEDPTV
jgi:Tryptophan-associated transmembrane protein (Trp_oprn_chp)